MGLEQRLLGHSPIYTPRIHGIFGQEEGHVRHEVVALASNCLPPHSFRLRVRIFIISWDSWLRRETRRFYWPDPRVQTRNWGQRLLPLSVVRHVTHS